MSALAQLVGTILALTMDAGARRLALTILGALMVLGVLAGGCMRTAPPCHVTITELEDAPVILEASDAAIGI